MDWVSKITIDLPINSKFNIENREKMRGILIALTNISCAKLDIHVMSSADILNGHKIKVEYTREFPIIRHLTVVHKNWDSLLVGRVA